MGYLEQKLQEGVRFLVFQADDLLGESGIDE